MRVRAQVRGIRRGGGGQHIHHHHGRHRQRSTTPRRDRCIRPFRLSQFTSSPPRFSPAPCSSQSPPLLHTQALSRSGKRSRPRKSASPTGTSSEAPALCQCDPHNAAPHPEHVPPARLCPPRSRGLRCTRSRPIPAQPGGVGGGSPTRTPAPAASASLGRDGQEGRDDAGPDPGDPDGRGQPPRRQPHLRGPQAERHQPHDQDPRLSPGRSESESGPDRPAPSAKPPAAAPRLVHTARARVSSPIQHWRARRQGRWQYPGPHHMQGAACQGRRPAPVAPLAPSPPGPAAALIYINI